MIVLFFSRQLKPYSALVRHYAKRSSVKLETAKSSLWQPVIGLEIHAQISSKSKLFSGSGTEFASPINSSVSFFDASLPGTLPMLNKSCVEAAVKTALALQSRINFISTFDRKHYFYADLPAGYQITQQRKPLANGGHLDYLIFSEDNGHHHKPVVKTARLIQIQLEQDSGKSLHDVELSHSLIDLNRAGVGLMEIVTEPDFKTSSEAASFVKELQLILQTIGACDGKMEEGSFRVDASISIRRQGEDLGVRAEIKNLNSVRSLSKAIDYEIERQISIKENGEEVVNETRSFDVEIGETVSMRDKEQLHDYRFMAEPNLPPLHLYTTQSLPSSGGIGADQLINVDDLRSNLPELPNAKRTRIQQQFNLSIEHSNILVSEPNLLVCYERCVGQGERNAKVTANICINEVLAAVNKKSVTFSNSHLTSEDIGELVDMLENGSISLTIAGKVLQVILEDPNQTPVQVVKDKGWLQIKETEILEKVCQQVLDENPKVVADYKSGKTKVLNFLFGQIQKKLSGQSDMKTVNEILQKKLKE